MRIMCSSSSQPTPASTSPLRELRTRCDLVTARPTQGPRADANHELASCSTAPSSARAPASGEPPTPQTTPSSSAGAPRRARRRARSEPPSTAGARRARRAAHRRRAASTAAKLAVAITGVRGTVLVELAVRRRARRRQRGRSRSGGPRRCPVPPSSPSPARPSRSPVGRACEHAERDQDHGYRHDRAGVPELAERDQDSAPRDRRRRPRARCPGRRQAPAGHLAPLGRNDPGSTARNRDDRESPTLAELNRACAGDACDAAAAEPPPQSGAPRPRARRADSTSSASRFDDDLRPLGRAPPYATCGTWLFHHVPFRDADRRSDLLPIIEPPSEVFGRLRPWQTLALSMQVGSGPFLFSTDIVRLSPLGSALCAAARISVWT